VSFDEISRRAELIFLSRDGTTIRTERLPQSPVTD
jgi:hypothetical protein